MIAVDKSKPVIPEVKSPIRMERAEFTVTLPKRIVHRSRFPLLRRGRIAIAYLASVSSSTVLNGPFVKSSKFLTSNPKSPRFKPEKHPDNSAKHTIKTYCKGGISTGGPSGVTHCGKFPPIVSAVATFSNKKIGFPPSPLTS